MAVKNLGQTQTLIAGAAITANRFVKLASGKVVTTAASDDESCGVANEAASAADKSVSVTMIDGAAIAIVESGAAIALGADVMSDAQGRAITAATSGNKVLGTLVDIPQNQAATAAGQLVSVLLQKKADVA